MFLGRRLGPQGLAQARQLVAIRQLSEPDANIRHRAHRNRIWIPHTIGSASPKSCSFQRLQMLTGEWKTDCWRKAGDYSNYRVLSVIAIYRQLPPSARCLASFAVEALH